jgi:glycosyltransferase involved in cell wall biosynthesis
MNGPAVPWSGQPVAVVHDWFQGYHGSERVVEVLARDVLAEGSRVDVITFHAARELMPPDLERRIVRESRLSRLPGVRQVGHDPGRWRYLLPYMPHYFRSLKLDEYGLVVISSHACALNANPPADIPCVCYCHTPMRYAWLGDTDRDRLSGVRAGALRALSGWLRRRDRAAAQRPCRFAANSTAVRERIRVFYGREAEVVHPPVDLSDLRSDGDGSRGEFLWVGRLVPYKRPELVVEAFHGLPHRLTMVGIGPLEESVRARLPENVELRGWITREELAGLYGRASGFVHVGEEDFGMTMVEALAAGSPVIALDAGGARDIVRDGIDGVLIAKASVDRLRTAVERAASIDWDAGSLAERAREFSTERFTSRMRALLSDAIASREGRVRARGRRPTRTTDSVSRPWAP